MRMKMKIADKEMMGPTIHRRTVTVLQLPEHLTVKSEWNFLREVERHMTLSRPFLVLDCSAISRIDRPTIFLLLRCLEEAMKRNGDVKLSGISINGDFSLGFFTANRLFEVFDTTEEAVNSFYKYSFNTDADAGESESAA